MISLGALKRDDMPWLLEWRNKFPEAWRDPRPTTITQQYEWFDGPVSHGPGWYWRIQDDKGHFLGQSEITNIYTGSGEIGLIVNPHNWESGIGMEAARLTLIKAFRYLGLQVVRGECYDCGAVDFWKKLVLKWHGYYDTTRYKKKSQDNHWFGALDFGWVWEMSLAAIENTGV